MPSPITVAALQAAGLNCISNLLAQVLAARRAARPFSFELLPLVRFAAMALLTAPPNYEWQTFLERKFPAYPTTQHRDAEKQDTPSVGQGNEETVRRISWKNTATKWFLDCISIGALLNTIAFLLFMGIMKGQDISQIKATIFNETGPLMLAGYKVWPFVSVVNFTLIPLERRIVFLSFVGLLWGIYMSFIAEKV